MKKVSLTVKSIQIEAPVGTFSAAWVFRVMNSEGKLAGESVQKSDTFSVKLEDGEYVGSCHRIDADGDDLGNLIEVPFTVAPDVSMVEAAGALSVSMV